MKYFLFSLFFFGLPHTLWIPRKLNIPISDIPLGVSNILLLIAVVLWVTNHNEGPKLSNPFKTVNLFILTVIFGIGVAAITSFEKEFMDTLINFKREVSLLLLYFLPLAIIKNKKNFTIFLIICLSVHFIVGLEVLRSGVLGGSSFHDGKRGAGPFGIGWGWEGADVAAGYLAQTLMIYLAFFFGGKINKWVRFLVGTGAFIIILAILATYARGALLAVGVGCIAIFISKGFHLKYLLMPMVVLIFAIWLMPASIQTRFSETKTETGELDSGTKGRLVYYATAFEIIKDYPIFGVGTAQVRPAMGKYMGSYVDPHNGLLYTTCEYGIIGLAIFLSMFWNFFTESIKILRDKTIDTVYRNYAAGMVGMISTLFVCNIFYANFYKELVLGTLMIHFGMLAFIKSALQQNFDNRSQGQTS